MNDMLGKATERDGLPIKSSMVTPPLQAIRSGLMLLVEDFRHFENEWNI